MNTVLAAGMEHEIKERRRKGESNGVCWVFYGISRYVLLYKVLKIRGSPQQTANCVLLA
jgi:hypothetical protein